MTLYNVLHNFSAGTKTEPLDGVQGGTIELNETQAQALVAEGLVSLAAEQPAMPAPAAKVEHSKKKAK